MANLLPLKKLIGITTLLRSATVYDLGSHVENKHYALQALTAGMPSYSGTPQ